MNFSIHLFELGIRSEEVEVFLLYTRDKMNLINFQEQEKNFLPQQKTSNFLLIISFYREKFLSVSAIEIIKKELKFFRI